MRGESYLSNLSTPNGGHHTWTPTCAGVSSNQVFGVDRKPGLSGYLTGRLGFEEGVRATGIPELFVIPKGVTPPDPLELLGGPLRRVGSRVPGVVVNDAKASGRYGYRYSYYYEYCAKEEGDRQRWQTKLLPFNGT